MAVRTFDRAVLVCHFDCRAAADAARVGRERTARLMREAGVVGTGHRQGGPAITRREHDAPPAPEPVDRKAAHRTSDSERLITKPPGFGCNC